MELQQRLCPPVKPVTGHQGEHSLCVKTAADSIMLVDELVLASQYVMEYVTTGKFGITFYLDVFLLHREKKNTKHQKKINNLLSGQTEEVQFSSKRGDPRLTFNFYCAVLKISFA